MLLHSYFSIERVIGVDDPAHDSGGDLIAINYDVDYTMVYGLKVFEEAESITRVFAYDNNTFTFAESESGALSNLYSSTTLAVMLASLLITSFW